MTHSDFVCLIASLWMILQLLKFYVIEPHPVVSGFTPVCAQRSLLVGFMGLYEMSDAESKHKANTLPTALSLQLLE